MTAVERETVNRPGRRLRRRRRRLRRVVWGVVAAAVVGLGLLGLFAVRATLSAKRDLQAARSILLSAKAGAFERPYAATLADLRRAKALTGRAAHTMDSPVFGVLARIPLAGRTPRGARMLTRAAAGAVDAAVVAASGFEDFVGADGKVHVHVASGGDAATGAQPAASWNAASTALGDAAARANQALAIARAVPSTWVPSPLTRARDELVAAVDEAAKSFRAGSNGTAVAPSLLGLDRPRTWLVVVQNLAQSRGLGGLIGGAAVLDARDGHFSVGRALNNSQLLDPAAPIDAPEWVAAKDDKFDARKKFQSVNVEPDFRVAAPMIAQMWRVTENQTVDGVIVVDPFALAGMLQATGPIAGPEGLTLDAQTFARLVMSDAYERFRDNRKDVLGAAMKAIFDRFVHVADERQMMSALSAAASGRHLMMWARDQADERRIAGMGADGAFEALGGATVGVVVQNDADNKIDFWLRRSTALDVTYEASGAARYSLTVAIENTAPATGLPYEVIGPATGPHAQLSKFKAGDSNSYVSAYLPRDAREVKVLRGGAQVPAQGTLTPSSFVISQYLRLSSKTRGSLTFTWAQEKALDGTGRLRTATIVLPKQPVAATDAIRVTVHGPAGYRLDATQIATPRPWLQTERIHVALATPLWRRFLNLL